MEVYDVLFRQTGNKNGEARWQKIGILVDKDGKLSLKLDFIPTSKDWDGWFIVSQHKKKEEPF
ncbi:MAG: hypothetical protein QW561_00640 [Candidatus Aenigmatarchaeota archaeon]